MSKTTTYEAFMLDHAAGNLSASMSVAGDLHILLNDEGAETCDLWRAAAQAMGPPPQKTRVDLSAACEIITNGTKDVNWRRGLSGAQFAKAGSHGGKFMRLRPGKSVPAHSHKKLEVTVVLQGQLSDGERVYNEGEIVFGEPGVRHKPAAHGDAPCVCYVATK